MAKQVFSVGSITAEDWSYLHVIAAAQLASPSKYSPEPQPAGLLKRMDDAPLAVKDQTQQIIADQAQRILDLEEQLKALGVDPAKK